MTRFLLTLLALLTGFAAHSVPAQARVGGASGAEVAAQLAESGTREVLARQIASRPEAVIDWPVNPRLNMLPMAVFTPTVLHGVDRARE